MKGKEITTIGLTGGIASGKTVAAAALLRAGYRIVDADEISRELTKRGSDAEAHIMSMFPDCVSCGALDRKKLRAVIASDPDAKGKLERYTHPLIIAETKKQLSGKAVLSAPLLFEAGMDKLCDIIICITCPREVRVCRIVSRDGISREDANKIIDAQMPDSIRESMSDIVVSSDVPMAEFEAKIVGLVGKLLK